MAIELIRGTDALTARHQGCVATIGKFDGVHLGHVAVLKRLKAVATEHGLPLTVISFEPLPHEVFNPNNPPARLSNLRERLFELERHGVNTLLILPFDARLSSMSPQNFVERLLVGQLGIRHLLVGDDFRFGKGRAGDFTYLQTAGTQLDFTVEDTPTVEVGQQRVSSGRIREALAENNLLLAETLLGRHYTVLGRVAHGDKRGRELGQPTANVLLKRRKVALRGVYAVQVTNLDDEAAMKCLHGVANVGVRPTIGGNKESLEVHIFDLPVETDLYGQHLAVQFRAFIRGEQRFSGLDELAAQIRKDSDQARAWLAAH